MVVGFGRLQTIASKESVSRLFVDPVFETRAVSGEADPFCQAEEPKRSDYIVADIELPPEETLVGRRGVVVVIVVPAFAQGDHRERERVLTGFTGFVAGLAPLMRQRVDAEGAVIEQDRRKKETAKERRPSAPQEDGQT